MWVRISLKTAKALHDIKRDGESVDGVIQRLLEAWRKWNLPETDFLKEA